MKVEEEYQDVLQNIEFGVVSAYRNHPALVDHDVARTLEAVMDSYKAEKIGRPPRPVALSPAEREMYEAVRGMCEWRLGRAALGGAVRDAPSIGPDEAVTVDEILLCLKRLVKSVHFWNRDAGQRGYLDYIVQFIR